MKRAAPTLGPSGLHAAMELPLEVGIENIAAELRERGSCRDSTEGTRPALEGAAGKRSAIVTFRVTADMHELHQKLKTRTC
jgi:hypothetical protein